MAWVVVLVMAVLGIVLVVVAVTGSQGTVWSAITSTVAPKTAASGKLTASSNLQSSAVAA